MPIVDATTTANAVTIACKVITLLVTLAWETQHRSEACEMAEQLIESLQGEQ